MLPGQVEKSRLHRCRHTCERPLAAPQSHKGGPVEIRRRRLPVALFFQVCRADIRGMRDSMERHQAKPCPICGRPSLERFRPFCSSRCADIDLGRWLSGGYAIATDEGGEPVEPQDN
jgi:uncharacterized protein